MRRLLTDHMRKLWAEIGFTPTSFQLPDEVESTGDEDTKDGDRTITEIKVPLENRPEISEEAMKKLTSLKLNIKYIDFKETKEKIYGRPVY